MLTIDLPELIAPRALLLELDPDEQGFKGLTAAKQTEPIAQRILLSGPLAVEIDKQDTDDHDLQVFMKREAKSFRYFLMHLQCDFKPSDDAPFEDAQIQIELRCADGERDLALIAWSMLPNDVVHTVKESTSTKLGAKLKLGISDVETGISGKGEIERIEHFASASGELSPEPMWTFKKTTGAAITGPQRLIMVVRAPRASQPRGRLQLKANIRRKRFGLIPYRAALNTGAAIEFTLGMSGK